MSEQELHILLCEDDANLASVIIEYFRAEKLEVDHARDGEESVEYIQSKSYDLCLLDAHMPKKDSLDLLHDLRAGGNMLPVILMFERDNKDDIIRGYEAGCDDYVVKPFSMDVLICKIHAILHRLQVAQESQECVFEIGNTTFDSVRQTLGKQHLSTRENDLLLMLARKTNQLVERSQILKALWQNDNYFAARSLAVYVNHLRHRMSEVKGARIIAVHGKGYKLVIDPTK